MEAQEVLTRIQMRLLEAHRERNGQTDLDAGYRLGLLHAVNVALNLQTEHEAEIRRQQEPPPTPETEEDDLCPRCGGDHDRIDRREPCPTGEVDR